MVVLLDLIIIKTLKNWETPCKLRELTYKETRAIYDLFKRAVIKELTWQRPYIGWGSETAGRAGVGLVTG